MNPGVGDSENPQLDMVMPQVLGTISYQQI
jgi:hypothetical protein